MVPVGLENKFHCTQWLLLLRGGKIPVKLTKKTGELEKCGQELKINSLTRYTDF